MKKKFPIPFSVHFRNAIGFSLTEVLIAMGLAGGLAVFMMKYFEQSAKQQSTISQRADFESLVTTVKMIVETQCDVNFMGSEFNTSGVLKDPKDKLHQAPWKLVAGVKTQDLATKQLILDTDKPFDGLKVSPFVIKVHPSQLDSIVPVLGDLIVSAEKDRGSNSRKSFGAQKMIKKIPISLHINVSNKKITSCQRGASPEEIPWGAVMAFNRVDCPPGWTRSNGGPIPSSIPSRSTRDLRGRNIIGTGQRPVVAPEESTNFDLGYNLGGEEKHKMKLDELVPHKHSYREKPWKKSFFKGEISSYEGEYEHGDDRQTALSTGAGNAFNVMDPYVALTYCEKN